jgi:hypothetical protein
MNAPCHAPKLIVAFVACYAAGAVALSLAAPRLVSCAAPDPDKPAAPCAGSEEDRPPLLASRRTLPASRWTSLLPAAGRPAAGVVLEAWLSENSPSGQNQPELVTSVRNTGGRRVFLGQDLEFEGHRPQVLVRTATDGLTRFTPPLRVGSGPAPSFRVFVEPGYAIGYTVPVQVLELPELGASAVLATRYLGGDVRTMLVSTPVKYEPSKRAAAPKTPTGAPAAAKPPGRTAPERLAGDQWSGLAAIAGQPHRGCVLQALVPSTHGKPPRLAVSFMCVGWDPWRDHHDSPSGGLGELPSDYRVLLRDASGRAVPPNAAAQKVSGAQELSRNIMNTNLRLGDAFGAVVPLADWFDLAKPGEYTALVSFTAPGRNGPTWVAEPVKFTVPAASK